MEESLGFYTYCLGSSTALHFKKIYSNPLRLGLEINQNILNHVPWHAYISSVDLATSAQFFTMVAERVIPPQCSIFFDDKSGHVIVILQLVSRAGSTRLNIIVT